MPKPSDYEYRSEQDPNDGRLNLLSSEDWEHYASDRGRLYFRRLKQPAEQKAQEQTLITTPAPPRETFQVPKPNHGKNKK
jgi:hypothetical protein